MGICQTRKSSVGSPEPKPADVTHTNSRSELYTDTEPRSTSHSQAPGKQVKLPCMKPPSVDLLSECSQPLLQRICTKYSLTTDQMNQIFRQYFGYPVDQDGFMGLTTLRQLYSNNRQNEVMDKTPRLPESRSRSASVSKTSTHGHPHIPANTRLDSFSSDFWVSFVNNATGHSSDTADQANLIDFGQFLELVCIFCILTREEISQFLFTTLDVEGHGYITVSEFERLLRSIEAYPNLPADIHEKIDAVREELLSDENLSNVSSAAATLTDSSRKQTPDVGLTYEAFCKLFEFYPFLFWPAITVQRHVQNSTLGIQAWRSLQKSLSSRADSPKRETVKERVTSSVLLSRREKKRHIGLRIKTEDGRNTITDKPVPIPDTVTAEDLNDKESPLVTAQPLRLPRAMSRSESRRSESRRKSSRPKSIEFNDPESRSKPAQLERSDSQSSLTLNEIVTDITPRTATPRRPDGEPVVTSTKRTPRRRDWDQDSLKSHEDEDGEESDGGESDGDGEEEEDGNTSEVEALSPARPSRSRSTHNRDISLETDTTDVSCSKSLASSLVSDDNTENSISLESDLTETENTENTDAGASEEKGIEPLSPRTPVASSQIISETRNRIVLGRYSAKALSEVHTVFPSVGTPNIDAHSRLHSRSRSTGGILRTRLSSLKLRALSHRTSRNRTPVDGVDEDDTDSEDSSVPGELVARQLSFPATPNIRESS